MSSENPCCVIEVTLETQTPVINVIFDSVSAPGPTGEKGADGKDGEDGKDGKDGASATITVSKTNTVSPTTPASVTNEGTASAASLIFNIPKGDTGSKGNDGDDAYEIAVANGFVGNVDDWLASLKGDKGNDGAAATINVAGTNTVSPGTPASVVNQGTANAASLLFNIPKGDTGAKGDKGSDGGVVGDMQNQKIINLQKGTADTDAVNTKQLTDAIRVSIDNSWSGAY